MEEFIKEIPDDEGWWLFLEEGDSDAQRLYIVGDKDHTEVADDDILAEKLGVNPEAIGSHNISNWWEMTPCKDMSGLWKKDSD